MKLIVVFIIFAIYTSFANSTEDRDYNYKIAPANFSNSGKIHTVSNMPNFLDQGAAGFCYAFTAKTLLERQRCFEKKITCSKVDPTDSYSTLDLARHSDYNGGIKEGGGVLRILENLKNKKKDSLYTEHCAPYTMLRHGSQNKTGDASLDYLSEPNEKNGLRLLQSTYQSNQRADQEQRICSAIFLKEALSLTASIDDIEAAFSSYKFYDFLLKALIPQNCTAENPTLDIPNYKTGFYPLIGENFSRDGLSRKIEELILNDIPVNLNFCTFPPGREDCTYSSAGGKICDTCGGHATVISGVKEMCFKNVCEIMYKVHNSYGEKWQTNKDGGWVRSTHILNGANKGAMLAKGKKNILTWITSPEKRIEPARLIRTLGTKEISGKNADNRYCPNGKTPVFYKCPGNNMLKKFKEGCAPLGC